jgi:hypothetical protein
MVYSSSSKQDVSGMHSMKPIFVLQVQHIDGSKNGYRKEYSKRYGNIIWESTMILKVSIGVSAVLMAP